ncbi:MAG: FAD-dependent oxidoreductase [Bacteroidales bacterium]
MDRRKFIRNVGITAIAVGVGPNLFASNGFFTNDKLKDSLKTGQWKYLGEEKKVQPKRDFSSKYDVAVIGAGIAGLSAAVSAARHGAKTILIQNRSVIGGNASSEVHVPINGAYHYKNKFEIDRETGIVEEIQIENRYHNPQASWEVWDHVLYDFVTREPNLTLMLNTHAIEAVTNGNKIETAICFQQSTDSKQHISADLFIDCSGDGTLAASAGADFRSGREGRDEFNESFAPVKPDGWVMGDSIQLSTKDMGHPVPFYPPSFTIKYEADKAVDRKITQLSCGFWWVELGSNFDIIGDTETNRHQLLGYLYGVWDYVKNSGDFPESANLALDWVGSVPGRRESRRFMGDFILSQNDLTEYKHFEDAIAYGGWSLDEHCPGGIKSLSERPSYFHAKFSKPYEIPYRCLYSRNISNLMFAGRNVSQTHMSLSSTRVMATCGVMGQAAGTAAAICINRKVLPRDIYKNYVIELQEQLLRDDCYIPNRPAFDPMDLARKAQISASSTKSGNVSLLVDGISRDEVDMIHHWESTGLNATLQLEWKDAQNISSVEIKCDTNLHTQIELHPNEAVRNAQTPGVPPEMIKSLSIEALIGGNWKEVAKMDNNLHRLIRINFPSVSSKSIRINLKETYGKPTIKLFEIRCY